MDLLSLPSDVMLYQLKLLPVKDLTSLCQTNSRFQKLTNNDYLWQLKSQLDYPTFIDKKKSGETWKYFYYGLLKPRLIPVCYAYEKYKNILIDPRLSLKKITNHILNQLNRRQVNITLMFGTDKTTLAFSTFVKKRCYYERICNNDPNWILTIDTIYLRERSVGALLIDKKLSDRDVLLLHYR